MTTAARVSRRPVSPRAEPLGCRGEDCPPSRAQKECNSPLLARAGGQSELSSPGVQPWVHLGRRNVRALTVTAGLFLTALAVGPAGADPSPVAPPPAAAVPQIRVTPLRDAGGLPESGKLGLNAQLTQGLIKFLTDQAQGRYTVIAVDPDTPRSAHRRRGRHGRDAAPPGGPQITLEGELSHVESAAGDKDGGGPYFCTLRLFREGTDKDASRRLTHGWVALARTYLDLTSNLGHDPRVDPEGLLGALAHRVIADVTDSEVVSPPAASVGSGPAPVQILDSEDAGH